MVTGDSPKGFVCSSSPRGITPLPSRCVIKYAANAIEIVDRAQSHLDFSLTVNESLELIDDLLEETNLSLAPSLGYDEQLQCDVPPKSNNLSSFFL